MSAHYTYNQLIMLENMKVTPQCVFQHNVLFKRHESKGAQSKQKNAERRLKKRRGRSATYEYNVKEKKY